MDRIAIAGWSLHDVEVEALERAKGALARDTLHASRELADALGASELVVLSTCNRLEIAYAREEGHRPSEDDLSELGAALGLNTEAGRSVLERAHFFRGRTAARHLFRVVCSLDSLVVGEGEIQAQVRDAYARAESARLCGALLGPLFQGALQLGKHVRSTTELAQHPISVVSIAVQRFAERLERQGPRDGVRAPAIALIGAGAMGELLAKNLGAAGLAPAFVVGRSRERAERLAGACGARAVGLAELREHLAVDALFSATSAPGVLLKAGDLADLARRAPRGAGLFAADLALPRDLEATDCAEVELFDLESLRTAAESNRARRARAALEAEKEVEQKLLVFEQRFATRALSDTLAEMQAETHDILEREIAQMFKSSLGELSSDQRRAVERFVRTAFGRIAHVPVAALKRLASETGASSPAPPPVEGIR